MSNKITKFILSFILLFCFSFILIGCDNSQTNTENNNVTSLEKYTIKWVVNDVVVETDTDVVAGSIPTYNGNTPTKEETSKASYTFSGWSPEITAVTNNQTYTAIFIENIKSYNISFYDETGNSLGTQLVKYGDTPSYDYEKTSTDEYNYIVTGWSNTVGGDALTSIPTVTCDASYYAVVEKNKNKYSITFDSNGGSSVSTIVEDYGTSIDEPTNPTYENYKFVSWCYDEELTEKVEWPITLTKNQKLYAKWNEKVDIKSYLSALLSSYNVNPMSFLPDSMRYDYEDNLVSSTDCEYDYTDFVNVSNIKYGGFGEQWNMVLTNINQSMTFFNVLSIVDGLSSTISLAYSNYLDTNPLDEATYNFTYGIYDVYINYEDGILSLKLEFTTTIAALGEQNAEIIIEYNPETLVKCCRVQLGDENALKYEASIDSYKFAIKYLGVRKASFEVAKDEDGNVTGSIYEYLTASDTTILSSCAEFYVTDEYVSVVGNKASGMVAFTGYINELYLKDTGKLVGYEVRETLSSITYNTLWFNLSDVSGITSIKQTIDDEVIYINGLSTEFAVKKVGGISLKTASRRYDIEMRKQYFYYYDSENDEYVEIESEVPMLFIQEEYLDSYSDDVGSSNDDLSSSVTLSETYIDKILSDYDTLIDVFIENKESISSNDIVTYIG